MTGGSLPLERSPHPDFDMGILGGKKCGYFSGIYGSPILLDKFIKAKF